MQCCQNETQSQKLLKLGVTQRHVCGFCHLRPYHTVATDCKIEITNGGIILVDAECRNALRKFFLHRTSKVWQRLPAAHLRLWVKSCSCYDHFGSAWAGGCPALPCSVSLLQGYLRKDHAIFVDGENNHSVPRSYVAHLASGNAVDRDVNRAFTCLADHELR